MSLCLDYHRSAYKMMLIYSKRRWWYWVIFDIIKLISEVPSAWEGSITYSRMGWNLFVWIYLFDKKYYHQMYLWGHNFPTPFMVTPLNLHPYVISNILLWWWWWYANRIYYQHVCQCMKNTFTVRYISSTILAS